MIYLYIIAIMFVGFGAIAWVASKTITWQEWAIGGVVALLTAGIFHGIAYFGQTADVEMWRGKVTKVVFYPEWVEEYQEAVYKTVTRTRTINGRTETYTDRVFSHYETKHRTHHEYWEANTNINLTQKINKETYKKFGNLLSGNQITKKVHKSGFDSGDPNIYYYDNEKNVIVAVNTTHFWDNRLKAAPSIYDFPKVSNEQQKMLYDWPSGNNWLSSGTLLGITKGLTSQEWDRLASKLGPLKQCNLIFIGFPKGYPNDIGQWQQAYWKGGKKNDIVITAGIGASSVSWVYAFGWSQDAQVFAELETIFLNNPINNDILPMVEKAVLKHYKRKEWEDFKHLSITPPMWVYWVYPIIIILTQSGLYIFFHYNEFIEGGKLRYKRFR